MLIQPTQNNIIKPKTLQPPPHTYPNILNPYNNVRNTRILLAKSPQIKVIRHS
jgi:hypothetical protein